MSQQLVAALISSLVGRFLPPGCSPDAAWEATAATTKQKDNATRIFSMKATPDQRLGGTRPRSTCSALRRVSERAAGRL
jgi:hypothetical protein